MKRVLFTLAILIGASSLPALAQQFITPNGSMSTKKPGTLTTTSGEVIEGTLRSLSFKKGLVKKISIETADGTKMKFTGEDVSAFAFPPSAFGKFASTMEASSTLERLGTADFDEIIDREFVYYEQGLIPGRKERLLLMQLINPGFDSKIKVYHDPFARETMSVGVGGMDLAGGNAKSYYVTKGDLTIKAEKKHYDEQFVELFGDCPTMLQNYPDPSWSDFAEHVFVYDQLCQE